MNFMSSHTVCCFLQVKPQPLFLIISILHLYSIPATMMAQQQQPAQPMNRLPSYVESILQTNGPVPLPTYKCDPEKLKRAHVHEVSKSVETVRPPALLNRRPESDYINKARQFVRDNAQLLHVASQDSITREDPILRHLNEEDVVTSANMHLLQPINWILYLLQTVFPLPADAAQLAGNLRVVASSSQPTTVFPSITTIVTVRQLLVTHTLKVRPDIAYYRTIGNILPDLKNGRVADNVNTRAFCIFELKDRGSICWFEFSILARTPLSAHADPWVANTVNAAEVYRVRARFETTRRMGYSDVAKRLLQQAGAYALAHRTQHVVLFDWDSLVLLRFHLMKFGPTTYAVWYGGVGMYVTITVVRNPAMMRPALLGFLLEAHNITPANNPDSA